MKSVAPDAPAALGLAALWGEKGEGVDARLRLSNADGQRRRRAVERVSSIGRVMTDQAIRALIYRFGPEGFRDALLLAQARSAEPDAFARHATTARAFTPPALPFSGHDVMAGGVLEGPKVAAVLSAAEARWIGEDFPSPDRARTILAEEIARTISTG
jgi:poly(A) polymerase